MPKLRYLLPIATLVLLTFGYLFVRPAYSLSTTTLTGTITDSQGNGVNGILTMQLPVPAQFNVNNSGCSGGSPAIVQPGVVSYQIVAGVIQPGPQLYDVMCLSPGNLFYVASVFDRTGSLLMRGNYVVTGASFNLGTATPTTITTSNISFANIAGSISTSSSNTWTAPQTFSQINSNTNANIAASGLIRLVNGDVIAWRNGNNTTDALIGFSNATNSLFQVSGNGVSGVGTCPANQFETANNSVGLSVTGAPTCAQPTTSNFSNGTTGSGAIVLANSPSVTTPALTTPTSTNAKFNTGVANNGTGLQHVRVTSCTPASGGNLGNDICSGTITWNTSFADTNYSIICTAGDNGGNYAFVSYITKSAGSFTYTFNASDPSTEPIDCLGIHD